MTTTSQRLTELGIELPPVAAPVAAYVPALVDRAVARTSGQLPSAGGSLTCTGSVGQGGTDPARAKEAARVAALNALAAAAEAAGGVDRLAGVVKVTGFVSSRPDFTGQAAVLNGASELYGEIFEGGHIRSAVGVAVLPLDASVEVEAEFALTEPA
jgi:enamine deaminase RidA (YjgF/YER057c/UK114 family)